MERLSASTAFSIGGRLACERWDEGFVPDRAPSGTGMPPLSPRVTGEAGRGGARPPPGRAEEGRGRETPAPRASPVRRPAHAANQNCPTRAAGSAEGAARVTHLGEWVERGESSRVCVLTEEKAGREHVSEGQCLSLALTLLFHTARPRPRSTPALLRPIAHTPKRALACGCTGAHSLFSSFLVPYKTKNAPP
jgi:hypothetical protein